MPGVPLGSPVFVRRFLLKKFPTIDDAIALAVTVKDGRFVHNIHRFCLPRDAPLTPNPAGRRVGAVERLRHPSFREVRGDVGRAKICSGTTAGAYFPRSG